MEPRLNPIMTNMIYKQFKIGVYTYGHPIIIGRGTVEIGKFSSFADSVLILTNKDQMPENTIAYPFNLMFTEREDEQAKLTTIGHDVHIGENCIIMPGVTIGNGVIAMDGTVIDQDVPPYAIITGNTFRIDRFRFADEWIDALNRRIQWWNWDVDAILKHLGILLQPPGDHLLPFFMKKK